MIKIKTYHKNISISNEVGVFSKFVHTAPNDKIPIELNGRL